MRPRAVRSICVLTAIITIALPQCLSAQPSTLRVVSTDGQAVAHASVIVEGGLPQVTDDRGEISLGHGTRQLFTVEVRRIGFKPWFGKVNFADTGSVFSVAVQRLGQSLDTVTVTGATAIKSSLELTGFYDRWLMRQKGTLSAVFIGPEELEFRHPDKVTNMLYGLNGVRMIRDKWGDPNPYSTQIASISGKLCPMAIIVDGQQIRNVSLDKYLEANEVMAIEIYSRGGNMPSSLHANDSICGVIVLWTGSRK